METLKRMIALVNLAIKNHKENVKKREADLAYIELNNLYLQVERGEKRLSIKIKNDMLFLIPAAYSGDDKLQTWWLEECYRLPRWHSI